MIELAPAPGELSKGLRAWQDVRDAEWQALVRRYQEAVSAFRRAVEISERRLSRAPPGRAPRVATPGRAARGAIPRWPRLTARQAEIAELIAAGLTNRQIAGALVLTEGTVANHVRHILLRLGVRCRAQVAAWVVAGEGAANPNRRARSRRGRVVGGWDG